jgi:FkbM family methyltransferase
MVGPEGAKYINGWFMPEAEIHFQEALTKADGYQERHRRHALSFVRKWRNAIDVGGHIATWSVDLAKKFNKVIAFEPHEVHRNCYVWNMKNRGLDNYELYPYCLGKEEGWVSLTQDDECSGNISIDPLKKDGDHELRTLDSFKFDDIDFIKVDVEGSELYVLQGSKETIIKCKPIIVIEQKAHAEKFGLKRYAASEYLKGLGMKELAKVVDDHIFGF